MKSSGSGALRLTALASLFAVLACNFMTAIAPPGAPPNYGQGAAPQAPPTPGLPAPLPLPPASPESAMQPTATAAVTHVVFPSNTVGSGKLIFDVVSEDTASDRRAPYGDSYDINRFERPFQQDMTYVPDLDIATFSVASDDNWWYVSMELVGSDPNSTLGIAYAVEIDRDHDGFGDYLIWAHPPYSTTWDTAPVQIYEDKNHDTGGRSAEKSDAPITTDGYEALIFKGGAGDPDPDLAWVRINAGSRATVQFSFKKSWSGTVFMLGVMADAGLKDPGKLDYMDRFTAADAGSSVRDNKNYPLKALFAVDNVCRAPFGFKANGYEPQLCPSTEPPATKKPKATAEPAEPPTVVPGPVLGEPPLPKCLPPGTLIDTPLGATPVENMRPGDAVWSVNAAGARFQATILQVSSVPVPPGHPIVHILRADGRELRASPGHPTADGRVLGDVRAGDLLDGTRVTRAEVLPSLQTATYDLLPSGPTGFYWANGVLIGSTLGD